MSKDNNQNNQNNTKQENRGSAFELPNYEFPRMEVPTAFREMAEKTMSQSKETYDRMKSAAEETSGLLENAFSTYSKGSADLTAKIIDNAQSNANAMFNFAKSLMQSKTVAEAIEKQTSFARSQFETLSTQGREIQNLGAKIANDTSEPLKTAAEKAAETFKQASDSSVETFKKTA